VGKSLISVIDDDKSVRRTTKLLIESLGFRAAAVESAKNFLSSGRLDDTSCLIVDLQLQSQLTATDCQIPNHFYHRLRQQRIPSASNASRRCRVSGKTFYRRAVTPMDSFSPMLRGRRHRENMIADQMEVMLQSFRVSDAQPCGFRGLSWEVYHGERQHSLANRSGLCAGQI
jgi:hypothetical protein